MSIPLWSSTLDIVNNASCPRVTQEESKRLETSKLETWKPAPIAKSPPASKSFSSAISVSTVNARTTVPAAFDIHMEP